MFAQARNSMLATLLLSCLRVMMMATPAFPAEPEADHPQLGLHFSELPRSVSQLRFVFECEDGLEIEARWIAQNVSDVAPADSLTRIIHGVTPTRSAFGPSSGRGQARK